MLNLVLNHNRENKGLVYTQYMLAKRYDVGDVLYCDYKVIAQIVNMRLY